MKITGWQKESFIDYPQKCSLVVFTSRCNYRCPTCHAKSIIEGRKEYDEEIIFNYLNSRKKWIDGVVICGGEPTRETSLKYFIRKIKERGLAVKLDTNGSNPTFLEELNQEKLVDYAAMDVKGPVNLYAKLTGKKFIDERDDVGKGIAAVSNFPNYEFRTTVVPLYEDEKLRWMTPEEIGETAELIYCYTGNKNHKYFLQEFIAREKDEMVDERFSKENLPKEFWETPKEILEKCLTEAKKYLPLAKIRG